MSNLPGPMAPSALAGGAVADTHQSLTVTGRAIRTSLHMPPALRTALKVLAVERDTTMSALIREAVKMGLRDPAALATASLRGRRVPTGVRTTLDLEPELHRALKRLAAQMDTSVQALIIATITDVVG